MSFADMQILTDLSSREPESTTSVNVRPCKVCGAPASGVFFGAVVCIPCKAFFIRTSAENLSALACHANQSCLVTSENRSCKFCRYNKCLAVGMRRKERPYAATTTTGQPICVVCGDLANGVHFGAITCEGCKKFFRRGLRDAVHYSCKSGGGCDISPQSRNSCRSCRFDKCVKAGMSRDAIQMGRPSKIRPQSQPLLSSQSSQSSRSSQNGASVDSSPIDSAALDAADLMTKVEDAVLDQLPIANLPDVDITDDPFSFISHELTDKKLSFFTSIGSCTNGLSFDGSALDTPVSSYVNSASKDCNGLSTHSTGSPLLGQAMLNIVPADLPKTKVEEEDKQLATVASFVLKNNDIITGAASFTEGDVRLAASHTKAIRAEDFLSQKFSELLPTFSLQMIRSFMNHSSVLMELTTIVDHDTYWKTAFLPDKNTLFNEDHMRQIIRVLENFEKYLEKLQLATLNMKKNLLENEGMLAEPKQHYSMRMLRNIMKEYIVATMDYCRNLQYFAIIDIADQAKLLRYAESQPRMLASAALWYNMEKEEFDHYYYCSKPTPERPDYVKYLAVSQFAKCIRPLEMDSIETALLASLVVIATDVPDLLQPEVVEQVRSYYLLLLRSYTTAKYGSENNRIEIVFSHIPLLRAINYLYFDAAQKTVFYDDDDDSSLASKLL